MTSTLSAQDDDMKSLHLPAPDKKQANQPIKKAYKRTKKVNTIQVNHFENKRPFIHMDEIERKVIKTEYVTEEKFVTSNRFESLDDEDLKDNIQFNIEVNNNIDDVSLDVIQYEQPFLKIKKVLKVPSVMVIKNDNSTIDEKFLDEMMNLPAFKVDIKTSKVFDEDLEDRLKQKERLLDLKLKVKKVLSQSQTHNIDIESTDDDVRLANMTIEFDNLKNIERDMKKWSKEVLIENIEFLIKIVRSFKALHNK
jgi:hypothetical protein